MLNSSLAARFCRGQMATIFRNASVTITDPVPRCTTPARSQRLSAPYPSPVHCTCSNTAHVSLLTRSSAATATSPPQLQCCLSPQSLKSPPPPPTFASSLSLTHVDTGTAYTTASSTTTGLTRPKSNCASWSGCSSRPTASTFWSLASTPRPSARARAPQPWGWCRRLARTCSARPSPACGSPARDPPLA